MTQNTTYLSDRPVTHFSFFPNALPKGGLMLSFTDRQGNAWTAHLDPNDYALLLSALQKGEPVDLKDIYTEKFDA